MHIILSRLDHYPVFIGVPEETSIPSDRNDSIHTKPVDKVKIVFFENKKYVYTKRESVNSWWPSVAILRQRPQLAGACSVPSHYSNRCWRVVKIVYPKDQTSMEFKSMHSNFHSRKCIWKYRLQKGGHFFSGLNIYNIKEQSPQDGIPENVLYRSVLSQCICYDVGKINMHNQNCHHYLCWIFYAQSKLSSLLMFCYHNSYIDILS